MKYGQVIFGFGFPLIVARSDTFDGSTVIGNRPFVIEVVDSMVGYSFAEDGLVGRGHFIQTPCPESVLNL